MKNILVAKFYKLTEAFFCYDDMDIISSRYEQACNLLVDSAKKYLYGIDKIIINRHTVRHDQEMFLHHAELLKDLYHSGDYNILYCDLDMVFVKPTRIFGKYNDFSMCQGNCGVRYYPAGGMTDQQWQTQAEWVSNWQTEFSKKDDRIHNWQYEQDMYNAMHDLEKHKFVNPFGPVVHNMYNHPSEEYSLVHCCGTSQQFDGLELQKELFELSLQGKHSEIHRKLQDPLYSTMIEDRNGAPWLGLT
jgi:hypothetical protein